MIISKENNVISNIDGAKFTFSNNPKLFNILSDKLYSDKIGSIIRELACNCADSHKAAGVNIPFNINLDIKNNVFSSNNTSTFSIEDFGLGLSENEIYSIYTCYGESTKSNSNEYIGAFGLGSKTPFSYTDSFYITSTYNGKRYFYLAYIDNESYPSISKLNEIETTEHNGLKIEFSIKNADIKEFKDKIYSELKRFNPLPIIVNDNNFWNKNKGINSIKYHGKNLNFCKDITRRSSYYPESLSALIDNKIEYDILNSSIKMDSIKAKFFYILQSNDSIELKFDIGELDLTASREEIEYTKRTIQNINKKIDLAIDEIFSLIFSKDENNSFKINSVELFEYICFRSDFFINIIGNEKFQMFINFLKENYEKRLKILDLKNLKIFCYSKSINSSFSKNHLFEINALSIDNMVNLLNRRYPHISKFIKSGNIVVTPIDNFVFINKFLTVKQITQNIKSSYRNSFIFIATHRTRRVKHDNFINELESFSEKTKIKFKEWEIEEHIDDENKGSTLDAIIFGSKKRLSINELLPNYIYVYKYKNRFYLDPSHNIIVSDSVISIIQNMCLFKNKNLVVLDYKIANKIEKFNISGEHFKIEHLKKFVIDFINDNTIGINEYLKQYILFEKDSDAKFVNTVSYNYNRIINDLNKKFKGDIVINRNSKIFKLANLQNERDQIYAKATRTNQNILSNFCYYFSILIKSIGLDNEILKILTNDKFYNRIKKEKDFILSDKNIILLCDVRVYDSSLPTEINDIVKNNILDFINKF